jgi:iron-sulfur cluster assembly protein
MLTCTPAAAKRISCYLSEHPDAAGLRVGVRTSGCSGLAYTFDVCKNLETDDNVIEAEGIRLVVSNRDLVFLKGSELHYERRGLNSTFQVRNPQEVARCGCGESFTVGRQA